MSKHLCSIVIIYITYRVPPPLWGVITLLILYILQTVAYAVKIETNQKVLSDTKGTFDLLDHLTLVLG